jgi:hypothetical protein
MFWEEKTEQEETEQEETESEETESEDMRFLLSFVIRYLSCSPEIPCIPRVWYNTAVYSAGRMCLSQSAVD